MQITKKYTGIGGSFLLNKQLFDITYLHMQEDYKGSKNSRAIIETLDRAILKNSRTAKMYGLMADTLSSGLNLIIYLKR